MDSLPHDLLAVTKRGSDNGKGSGENDGLGQVDVGRDSGDLDRCVRARGVRRAAPSQMLLHQRPLLLVLRQPPPPSVLLLLLLVVLWFSLTVKDSGERRLSSSSLCRGPAALFFFNLFSLTGKRFVARNGEGGKVCNRRRRERERMDEAALDAASAVFRAGGEEMGAPDYVINPRTNKRIQRNGGTYLKLVSEGETNFRPAGPPARASKPARPAAVPSNNNPPRQRLARGGGGGGGTSLTEKKVRWADETYAKESQVGRAPPFAAGAEDLYDGQEELVARRGGRGPGAPPLWPGERRAPSAPPPSAAEGQWPGTRPTPPLPPRPSRSDSGGAGDGVVWPREGEGASKAAAEFEWRSHPAPNIFASMAGSGGKPPLNNRSACHQHPIGGCFCAILPASTAAASASTQGPLFSAGNPSAPPMLTAGGRGHLTHPPPLSLGPSASQVWGRNPPGRFAGPTVAGHFAGTTVAGPTVQRTASAMDVDG